MKILVQWWSKATCFCGNAEPLGGELRRTTTPRDMPFHYQPPGRLCATNLFSSRFAELGSTSVTLADFCLASGSRLGEMRASVTWRHLTRHTVFKRLVLFEDQPRSNCYDTTRISGIKSTGSTVHP